MRKLKNPYAAKEGYFCFGCSPANPFGLQMEFYEDGDEIFCKWDPRENYQGYHRVLHGGVQATLMDEIASWYVFVKLKTSGVTKSIQVEYKEQVNIDNGVIELRASVEHAERKTAVMHCRLYQQGSMKAEARCEYAIFSEAVARKKLHYPGVEAFYTS